MKELSDDDLRQSINDLSAHLDVMAVEGMVWTTTNIAVIALAFAFERCAEVLHNTLGQRRADREWLVNEYMEISEQILRVHQK